MCSKKQQRYYSCGHLRPRDPIRATIAHAKPLLHPHSQPEPRRQTLQPQDTGFPPSPSYSCPVIFNNPFNDPDAPPPYFSLNASHENSQAKVSPSSSTGRLERELTAEERVEAGMEYMHAFLASRSSASSTTSSRTSSTAPTLQKDLDRRAAISAA